MDAKRTYLYLLFFVACLASSCTSDAPDDVDVRKGSEVSFGVSDLTRTVTTDINTPGSAFAVYGDMKEGNQADPSVLFDKTEVKYQNGRWDYEGAQYWFPGCEHSFVAITPLSVLDNASYSQSALSFTYTIPTTDGNLSDKNDVPDILVATHRRLYESENENQNKNTKVVFWFGHVMSLINIAPKLDDNIMSKDEYIEFHTLELSGFKTTATFEILPAPRQSNSQTDDRMIGVTEQKGEGSGHLTIEFKAPVQVKNGESVSLFDDKEALIMLPQTFDPGSETKIILTYTVNNDPSIKQVTIPLQNLQWESGKGYTYRFTINRQGLLFGTTTITDWEKMGTTNINAH